MPPRIRASVESRTLPPNFFTVFKKKAILLANKQNKKFAREIIKEVRSTILKQKFKWKPLSDGYKKSKKRKGLDKRIYIATRDYLDHGIGWWVEGKAVRVGPKEGTHGPSGLTYRKLARIHEFGTLDGRIPARPLWRPVHSIILRMRKQYARAYAKGVRDAAKQAAKVKRSRKKF